MDKSVHHVLQDPPDSPTSSTVLTTPFPLPPGTTEDHRQDQGTRSENEIDSARSPNTGDSKHATSPTQTADSPSDPVVPTSDPSSTARDHTADQKSSRVTPFFMTAPVLAGNAPESLNLPTPVVSIPQNGLDTKSSAPPKVKEGDSPGSVMSFKQEVNLEDYPVMGASVWPVGPTPSTLAPAVENKAPVSLAASDVAVDGHATPSDFLRTEVRPGDVESRLAAPHASAIDSKGGLASRPAAVAAGAGAAGLIAGAGAAALHGGDSPSKDMPVLNKVPSRSYATPPTITTHYDRPLPEAVPGPAADGAVRPNLSRDMSGGSYSGRSLKSLKSLRSKSKRNSAVVAPVISPPIPVSQPDQSTASGAKSGPISASTLAALGVGAGGAAGAAAATTAGPNLNAPNATGPGYNTINAGITPPRSLASTPVGGDAPKTPSRQNSLRRKPAPVYYEIENPPRVGKNQVPPQLEPAGKPPSEGLKDAEAGKASSHVPGAVAAGGAGALAGLGAAALAAKHNGNGIVLPGVSEGAYGPSSPTSPGTESRAIAREAVAPSTAFPASASQVASTGEVRRGTAVVQEPAQLVNTDPTGPSPAPVFQLVDNPPRQATLETTADHNSVAGSIHYATPDRRLSGEPESLGGTVGSRRSRGSGSLGMGVTGVAPMLAGGRDIGVLEEDVSSRNGAGDHVSLAGDSAKPVDKIVNNSPAADATGAEAVAGGPLATETGSTARAAEAKPVVNPAHPSSGAVPTDTTDHGHKRLATAGAVGAAGAAGLAAGAAVDRHQRPKSAKEGKLGMMDTIRNYGSRNGTRSSLHARGPNAPEQDPYPRPQTVQGSAVAPAAAAEESRRIAEGRRPLSASGGEQNQRNFALAGGRKLSRDEDPEVAMNGDRLSKGYGEDNYGGPELQSPQSHRPARLPHLGALAAGGATGIAIGEVASRERQHDLQHSNDHLHLGAGRHSHSAEGLPGRLYDHGPVPPVPPLPSEYAHYAAQPQSGHSRSRSAAAYGVRHPTTGAGGAFMEALPEDPAMMGNGVRRSGTVMSRRTARTGLSRTGSSRGGAFAGGAGLSVGTLPEETMHRDEIHARAEESERMLNPATLRKLSQMEKKDAKRLAKLLKEEGKEQQRSIQANIKDLERLVKMQKEAITHERRAQKEVAKATATENRARQRWMKEKERYERIENMLRVAEVQHQERMEHSADITAQIQDKQLDLDDARAQMAVDSREREVKLKALKNPAHS